MEVKGNLHVCGDIYANNLTRGLRSYGWIWDTTLRDFNADGNIYDVYRKSGVLHVVITRIKANGEVGYFQGLAGQFGSRTSLNYTVFSNLSL